MNKVAIIQSCYIPWKGYFDIINYVDKFVIYDDVQYGKRTWQNRNQIIINKKLKWLTIPVKVKSKFSQKINEVEVLDNKWSHNHLQSIKKNYNNLNYEFMKKLTINYNNMSKIDNLSKINKSFIDLILNFLEIKTDIYSSSLIEYKKTSNKNGRLINILKELKATTYVTTKTAQSYLDYESFKKNNIKIEIFDYDGYKEYSQNSNNFINNVSIIDLIFNKNKDYKKYMKTFNE